MLNFWTPIPDRNFTRHPGLLFVTGLAPRAPPSQASSINCAFPGALARGELKNEQTFVAMSSLNFRRAPSEKLKPKAPETPRLR